MEKKLKIPPEKLRRLVQTMGACSATDEITVAGKDVGWMCRVEPETEGDSGRRPPHCSAAGDRLVDARRSRAGRVDLGAAFVDHLDMRARADRPASPESREQKRDDE